MTSRSQSDRLKALVNERLKEAAEEIFGLFERALVDYEEEVSRSKREIERQRKLLAGGRAPPLLPVSEEEVLPEWQLCMQERTSCVDQKDPGPPQIKEELWTSQAEEHLQESGNVDAKDSMFNIIYVQRSDHDEDGRQSPPLCQSEQNAECDPTPSTSTDQIKTEPDGEGCRESEPTSDCPSFSSRRSVVESEDSGSDEDWSNKTCLKTKKPQQLGDLVKKPYSCSVCNKTFGFRSILSRHMKTHTGEKPYSCSTCGKRFIQRSYLQTHVNSHSGQKPHTCSLCGRGFTQVGNMNAHMRIHTGEKPHSCTDCGKGFREKADLIKHTIIHTGMRYLQKNADTGVLERGLKNKWRWQWLEETDSQGQRYDVWLAKVDIPGMAWCKLCNRNIVYAQNGKKVFARHTGDHHHKEMVNQPQHTQTLPS